MKKELFALPPIEPLALRRFHTNEASEMAKRGEAR
jgi:hypothetical protein